MFRRKLEEKGKNTNSALCGEETHEKDMSLVDLLDPSFQYKIERQTEDKIAKRKLQASLQIQAKMIINCKNILPLSSTATNIDEQFVHVFYMK